MQYDSIMYKMTTTIIIIIIIIIMTIIANLTQHYN
eukprot:COSAG06_NODE_4397_length_4298_cov_111.854727_4_plen_35_part_00